MNIIVPILYGTVLLGLFTSRTNRSVHKLATLLILAVLLKYYASN